MSNKLEKAREYLNRADDVSPRLAYMALRATVAMILEHLEETEKQ